MGTTYTKTLEDEIDWKIIDQLHTATLNFSSASIEIKKIYFIMIGIAVPTLVKLAEDKLDISLFITLYLITLTFWFIDSYTYYYQEKLRRKMDSHFKSIKNRNLGSEIITLDNPAIYTIEDNRDKDSSLRRSIFGNAVRIYHILLILNTLGIILFSLNWI